MAYNFLKFKNKMFHKCTQVPSYSHIYFTTNVIHEQNNTQDTHIYIISEIVKIVLIYNISYWQNRISVIPVCSSFFDGYHIPDDIAPLIVFTRPTSKIPTMFYCTHMIDPDQTKRNSIMRFNLENLIGFWGLS